ncbi:DUF4391 domain-containing protein [Luteimonas sp. A277]
MNAAIFDWPPATRVERLISKTEMLARAGKPRGLRERIGRELAGITWACKLATATLNLPPGGLPEIQVFRLRLKSGVDTASEPLLRAIDQAIPSPLVFELEGEAALCTVAAPKRPSAAAAGRQVLGNYLAGEWAGSGTPRQPLPVALDIAGLHQALLRELVPLAPRRGESFDQLLARLEAVRSAERNCTRLERQLKSERQFNLRIEINQKLRIARTLLGELTLGHD